MAEIKAVLWDVDGTLLDFLAAERAAIKTCFSLFGLGECTDEMITQYSAINVRWWQALERGEYTKPEILVGRFVEFFAVHRNIVGVNLMYFPSAVIEMIGYLTLTLVASFLLRRLEKLMDGSDSYELVNNDQLTAVAGTYTHPGKGSPYDEHSREFGGEKKNGGFGSKGGK